MPTAHISTADPAPGAPLRPWDLAGDRFDVGDGTRLQPPRAPYLVCSTPRSGSSLLCDALALTGRMGAPIEYFNPDHRRALSERWGISPQLASYATRPLRTADHPRRRLRVQTPLGARPLAAGGDAG